MEKRKVETNNDDGSHFDMLVRWVKQRGGQAEHDGTDLFVECVSNGEVSSKAVHVGDWILHKDGQFYSCTEEVTCFLAREKKVKPSGFHNELMHATEARKRVDELSDARGSKLQQDAKQRIESAVEAGQTNVSLDVDFKDHSRLKSWLGNLGYKVNAGKSQRDGAWFQVSW